MTPERADYLARNFVNGLCKHGKTGKMEPAAGCFHERFMSHPWVRESITECWDRELRGHLVHVCKLKLMRREPIGDIEMLMPDRKWVEDAKHKASRYAAAARWRHKKYGKTDGVALLRRIGIHDPGEAT